MQQTTKGIHNVTKKVYMFGTLCFLVAILFALSAIGKTISKDSFVIGLQWFCTMIFAIAGFWYIQRKT